MKTVILFQKGFDHLYAALTWLFPAKEGLVRAPNRGVETVGLLGLLLTALLMGVTRDQYIGGVLMLIAFLCSWRVVWPRIQKEPLFWLTFGWILYLCLLALWAEYTLPDIANSHWNHARTLAQLYLVILVAWWIGGSLRALQGVLMLILLAALWLVFREVVAAGWDFSILLGTERLQFVARANAQHFGLFGAAVLVGLLMLAKDFWGPPQRRWLFGMRLLLWTVLLLLIFLAFTTTQVRIQWIALGIFLPVAVLGILWTALRQKQQRRPLLLFVLVLLIVSAGAAGWQSERILDRFERENKTFEQIREGSLKPDTTSAGIRIYLWQVAIEEIKENPILGAGPASASHAIRSAKVPKRVKRHRSIHNSYLESLLRTGLVGAAFLTAALGLVLYALIQSHRNGMLPGRYTLFFVGALIVFLMGNMTESFIRHQFGWYFFGLMAGSIYTFRLFRPTPPSGAEE